MPKIKKKYPVRLSFLPEDFRTAILNVFDRYEKSGLLGGIKSPGEKPEFPSKVSDITLSELRDYHTQFEAWLGYTRDKLKYWKVVKTVISDFMDDKYNKAMAELRTKGGNIESKKAEARTDKDYLEIKEYYVQVSALEEMIYQESERLTSNVMSLRAEMRSRELNASY